MSAKRAKGPKKAEFWERVRLATDAVAVMKGASQEQLAAVGIVAHPVNVYDQMNAASRDANDTISALGNALTGAMESQAVSAYNPAAQALGIVLIASSTPCRHLASALGQREALYTLATGRMGCLDECAAQWVAQGPMNTTGCDFCGVVPKNNIFYKFGFAFFGTSILGDLCQGCNDKVSAIYASDAEARP